MVDVGLTDKQKEVLAKGGTVELQQRTGEKVVFKPGGQVIISGGRGFIERKRKELGVKQGGELDKISAVGQVIERAKTIEGIKETPQEISLMAKRTRLQREVLMRNLITVTDPFAKVSKKLFDVAGKVEEPIRKFISISASDTFAGKFVKAAIPAVFSAPILLAGTLTSVPVGAEVILKSPKLGLMAAGITLLAAKEEIKLRPFKSAGRLTGSALSLGLISSGGKKLTGKISGKFRQQTFIPTEKSKFITKFSVGDKAINIDTVGRAKGVVISELPGGFGKRTFPTEVGFKFKGKSIDTGKIGLTTRTVTDLGKGKIITSIPTGERLTSLTRGTLKTTVKIDLPKLTKVRLREALIQAESSGFEKIGLELGKIKLGKRGFDISVKTLEPKGKITAVSKVFEKFKKTDKGGVSFGFGLSAKGKDVTVNVFESVAKKVDVPILSDSSLTGGITSGRQVLKLQQTSSPVLSIFSQEAQLKATQIGLQEAVKLDVSKVGGLIKGVGDLGVPSSVLLKEDVKGKTKLPEVNVETILVSSKKIIVDKKGKSLTGKVSRKQVSKQKKKTVSKIITLKKEKATKFENKFTQGFSKISGFKLLQKSSQKLALGQTRKQIIKLKASPFRSPEFLFTRFDSEAFPQNILPGLRSSKKKFKKLLKSPSKKKKPVKKKTKGPFVFPSSAVVFRAFSLGKRVKVPKQTKVTKRKLFRSAVGGKLSKFDPSGVLKIKRFKL